MSIGIGQTHTQATATTVQQATIQTTAQAFLQALKCDVDCSIMQMTQLELKQKIDNLIDSGVLTDQPASISCPECGSSLEFGATFCLRCNWTADKSASDEEVKETEDEQIDGHVDVDDMDGHEIPKSEEFMEDDEDLPAETDPREVLSSFLKQSGFTDEEADLGTSILLNVFPSMKKWGVENLEKEGTKIVENIFNDEKEAKNALNLWQKIIKLPEVENLVFVCDLINQLPVPKQTTVPMIAIKKIDNEFAVIVKNPYENLEVSKGKGSIDDIPFVNKDKKIGCSADFWSKRLRNLPETLKKIGNALLKKREDFFKAESKDDAEKILKEKPLTGNALAEAAGIHASTLTRQKKGWARLIGTPWGTKELQDFLGESSAGSKDLRVSHAIELIRQLIEEKKVASHIQNITAVDLQKELKEKEGVELSKRTFRYYKKMIEDELDKQNV